MSNKETVYEQLRADMMSYGDYAAIPVVECGEELVALSEVPGIITSVIREDALAITGVATYVRSGVLKRLEEASSLLARRLPGAVLDVGYGYRALSVQRSRFESVAAKLAQDYDGEALKIAAHRQVAVPEVAGHPAGAAVDIAINKNGMQLDFGTAMWDFTNDSYTLSPFVSKTATRNRLLLQDCMQEAGFAPFLGEWWHFSHGDKEWAACYQQDNAIYDQLEFRA